MFFTLKLTPKTIAIGIAIVFVASFIYFVLWPIPQAERKKVVIPEGSGLNQIASILKEEGFIKSKNVFIFYTLALGEDKNLKAGKYVFSGRINTNTIIKALSSGSSISDDLVVTIPEGFNIWQIDELLTKQGIISNGEISWPYYSLEGYLFPDTYRFEKDSTAKDIKNKMLGNFNDKTSDLLKNLTPTEKENIIILASILEKEAKTEKDMRLVAGIINKRISIDMLIQVDATVGYGACLRDLFLSSNTRFYCDVTQVAIAREIKVDSPYNSYIRRGLPAGPISNPGVMAIKTAINPMASEYFYYLSTRLGDQIIYSKTDQEHLANRRKHLGF